MIKIQVTAATGATGIEFALTDKEVGRDDQVRLAVKADSNFDSKTLKLQVAAPDDGTWYETGISLSDTNGAAVIKLRPNYKYRLIPSATGGAVNITVMFF